MGCPNKINGKHNCSCAPPIRNRNIAWMVFGLSVVGGGLFLLFDNFKIHEGQDLHLQGMGMIAVLGFLTGLHCIGMCGGFMMSYIKEAQLKGMSGLEMHSRYAISKVFSYTAFGALFGALGSLIYISNGIKSGASLIGGIVLLFLGAKGLGLLQKMGKLNFSPLLSRFSGPTGVGLMKGFMLSCGPLQALYILSASTGDPWQGAKMLAVFGVSSLPIFLFYGSMLSTLTWFKSKWADIITSVIIVFFGMMMISRGMALSGYNFELFKTKKNGIHQNDQFEEGFQTLYLEVGKRGYSRDVIYYQGHKKICWEILVEDLTNCNKAIEIPEFNISKELQEGYNYIEFEPGSVDNITFTCWMGMMKGKFELLDVHPDSLRMAYSIPNTTSKH